MNVSTPQYKLSAPTVTALIDWYHTNKRAMPWRETSDPYRIWISEIMLQQTQVATVIPYYERFVDCFPSVEALAATKEENVLKLWQGLGYYRRGRNLHKAACQITAQGRLPNCFEEWLQCPGVGRYTAAAISSIAHGESVPVVDGNVIRVFCRYWAIEDDARKPNVANQLFSALAKPIATTTAADFNQAVMELGALTCTPQNPLCSKCPLSSSCKALKQGKVATLPHKPKAAPIPHYFVGVMCMICNGHIYMQKRPHNVMLAGLWEFPGGKQDHKHGIQLATCAKTQQETGIAIDCKKVKLLHTLKHSYSHFKISLSAYSTELPQESMQQPNIIHNYQWISLKSKSPTPPMPITSHKIFDKAATYYSEKCSDVSNN